MNDNAPTLSTKQIHASLARDLAPSGVEQPSNHLDPLATAFIRAVRGDEVSENGAPSVTAVSVPPRFGVTTLLRHAMALAIVADPMLRIGYATYSHTVARHVSRACAKIVQTTPVPGIGAPLNVSANDTWTEWSTADGGGVYAFGVGGALAARTFDLLVIDAPFKTTREGTDPQHQEAVFKWFLDVPICRVGPGGAVLLAGPRMARGDLHGRILDEFTVEWTRIPATRRGCATWPTRFSTGALESIRAEIGEDNFVALCQGQPRA